ncbi:MAG: WYL domain-containing protein [Clostridia bacterium]|nr:WYL domain-containing protein [Clostridia bacterium]
MTIMPRSQKQKLLTLLEILYRETDEDHPLSVPRLVTLLAERGVVCERKALYRDIGSLIDFGFDILQSTAPPGYYWGTRLFELPELRMLTDCVKSSEFITEKKTVELIGKLRQLTSRHLAEELEPSGGILGIPKNRNEGIYYNIDTLHTAIHRQQKVHFSYYRHVICGGRAVARKSHEFTVSPYALIWNDGKYYLVANYDKYDDFSHYRVDRMRQVTILAEPIRPLHEVSHFRGSFDEGSYMSSLFSMYAGSYVDYIDLRCAMNCMEHVVERFGQNIRYHMLDDNCFTIRVKAVINDGLVSWILAQRGGISVLFPPELRQHMQRTLAAMLDAAQSF